MESSRRDLFIDMVFDRLNFKNNQITLSPCFTFIPKTGVGLPKPGVRFYCEPLSRNLMNLQIPASGLISYKSTVVTALCE